MWQHLAKIQGYTHEWWVIGNTSTYGQAYPVEWYRTKEDADKAIEEKNKAEKQRSFFP